MRIALSLLFMISIALTGCKKKEADKAPEPTGSAGSAAATPDAGATAAADAGSAAAPDAAAPSGDGSAAPMSKRGGNCPSMVAGVTTAATADATSVKVTVMASDADAIASVQKRSEELLSEKEDPAAGGTHNQKGTYGGGLGLCPVGTNGATAKLEKTDKGVIITLTPADGTSVADLKAKVDERIKAAAEYVAANIKPAATEDVGNGGAVGGGKGDHGSNHSGKGDGTGKKGDGKGKSDGTGGGGGAGTGGGGGKDKAK